MELIFLLKGIFIGFAMAVPIGPIGIMCIRKTLTEGRLRGLIIGLGAATADLLYGCVAAFGLTYISNAISNEKLWIRLIGGTLLLFLGIKTFRAKPADPKSNIHSSGMLGSYLYTVFLTLTNPLTIFAFIAVFAALGLGNEVNVFSGSALVIGVFIGSCLWFLSLSSGVTLFRKKLDIIGLGWVNRIAGILIILSGVIAIVSVL
ncbi:MAG TPA: LysE family transporter [Ignavibacteriaceae bacterium]|nr:LysE family transporter [Ignavibacteriaceae bacterium]